MVDVHPVRRPRGEFASVECRGGSDDDRPCLCGRGRFAGEVPGVEFGEGSVDVVGVESDARHDPLVGVDLDDAENLGVERLGPLVSADKAVTTQGESFAAGRNDVRRHFSYAEIGDRPQACDLVIPTAS